MAKKRSDARREQATAEAYYCMPHKEAQHATQQMTAYPPFSGEDVSVDQKYFYIETLGCKVNQYDTQILREQLVARGYIESTSGALPKNRDDLIVINTCTVTGRADQKCRNLIRRFAREKGGAKVIVTGCYVDGDSREVLRRMPGVDAFLGNDGKRDILRFLYNEEPRPDRTTITSFEGRTRAFLKIQDGCDQYCSYCIVPYVRGWPKSKEPATVLREAKEILSKGYRELVVTGVHLGAYSRGLKRAAALEEVLEKISEIDGKFRLRIGSVEPMNVGPELFRRLSGLAKLCPHFHIPLQSGDDAVLKRMNRRYTFAEYRKIADAVYGNFPDSAITTDIIVGFPGETDKQFENSVKAVRQIGFSKVHVFPFSPRSGTKAFSFEGKIDPKEMKRRASELASVSDETAMRLKMRMVGRTEEVLVEEKAEGRYLSGFTENYQKVKFVGDGKLKNSFVDISIEGAMKDHIFGAYTLNLK